MSRDRAGALFSSLVESGEIHLTTHACIEFVPLETPTLVATDWLFFYSPTSVELFFKRFELSGQSVGALGGGTAAALKQLGVQVRFEGDGAHPEDAINEFAKGLGKQETVLTPIGNKSLSRLAHCIDAEQLVEFVHYETRFKKDIPDSGADFLIMTSPSNAQAYFGQHEPKSNQKVIAIGQTTFQALEELGIENKMASQTPSEDGFWKAIQADWN